MRTMGAVIALVLLVCCGCRYAPQAAPSGGPPGVDALRVDLTTLLGDESFSVSQVVRNAATIVRERCLGQSWAQVNAALERQGMPLISENPSRYITIRRYLVRSAARTAANVPFDCFIELSEDRRDADATPGAHPGQVLAASAGLTASVGRPYADVAAAQPPEPRDIVSQVLLRDDLAATAATFPSLDTIEVTYDLIRDRWSNRVPSGLHLRFACSIDGTDKIGGRRSVFVVESGLDAPQTWDGVPLLEGFSSQDTLGEPRLLGNTEWWQGDAATVAANKAKYLGKR